MQFALGVIAGLVAATFVAAVLAYFKKPIIQALASAETTLGNAGPRPQGFIIEPKPEVDIMRERRIAENKAKGLDTPIDELR